MIQLIHDIISWQSFSAIGTEDKNRTRNHLSNLQQFTMFVRF